MDLSPDRDLVGGWLQLPGSASAELMGSAGFDFVCVDQQHGLIGDDALLPMLQGLAAAGTPSLVRVTANEPAVIGRALDRGAAGVIVPLVDSPEETDAAVAACHHPPRGSRSYGPTRAGWGGARPDPVCVVMVETTVAVAALPRMLEVDDLDGIFIGPSDLALSAGMPLTAQNGDPAYDDLLRQIIEPCRERGMPVGIFCASAAHVRRFRAMGCSFFALMSDAALLRDAAADHLRLSRAAVPTLYDWCGGSPALHRLTEVFYDRVLADPVLEPVFRHMGAQHRDHVARWLGEVFGGPAEYTGQLGGYPAMLSHHIGLEITEEQRSRWAALIAASADAAGLPADPEFRSAFVAYVEWGTRIAVANSAKDATPPANLPSPRWGWGEAPPYDG